MALRVESNRRCPRTYGIHVKTVPAQKNVFVHTTLKLKPDETLIIAKRNIILVWRYESNSCCPRTYGKPCLLKKPY
jgi:hypothetical protein